MYCPHCGARLQSSDAYCPGCGAALGAKKKSTLPWLITAICALALIVTALLVLLLLPAREAAMPPVQGANGPAQTTGGQPTAAPTPTPSPTAGQGQTGAALPPVSVPGQTSAPGAVPAVSPAPATAPANAPVPAPATAPANAPVPAPGTAPATTPAEAADPVADFLTNNRSIRTGLYPWGDAFRISGYALVDLSGDGVPELLLSTNVSTFFEAEITGVLVCTVNGSSITPVYYTDTDTVWPIPELLYDRWMVTRAHGTGGYCESTYMTLNSRGIDIMREVDPGLDEGDPSYYIGDQEVPPEVFDQELLIRADHNTAPLRQIVFTPLR